MILGVTIGLSINMMSVVVEKVCVIIVFSSSSSCFGYFDRRN
jgi:hypothetical protein